MAYVRVSQYVYLETNSFSLLTSNSDSVKTLPKKPEDGKLFLIIKICSRSSDIISLELTNVCKKIPSIILIRMIG